MLVGRRRKTQISHIYRMANVSFGTLLSAFEISCHRRACMVNTSQNKSICLSTEERATFRWLWSLCRCSSFDAEVCLWDPTYAVFNNVFILLCTDFADESHVAGFAICFVRTSARLSHAALQAASCPVVNSHRLSRERSTSVAIWSHFRGRRPGGGGSRAASPLGISLPRHRLPLDAQVLLILTAALHWAWWVMKLMIDDYLRAHSPPEQANAGPGCTVINLPSANASDLPTLRGRALLSYMRVHMS